MYRLHAYGQMLLDPVRRDAYLRALEQTIRPGDVVVEIGTGMGYFAVHACRLGARRVYAIEPADVIAVGPEVAALNGYADRIEFIQDFSENITLPEQANVLFMDLRDLTPLNGRSIPTLADARQRFLAPGGALIPQRDALWAVPIEAPELYRYCLTAWGGLEDVQMEPMRRRAVNAVYPARTEPIRLLSAAQRWATLDYACIEDPNIEADLRWEIEADGQAHGVNAWFDAELCPGVSFSNAPGEPLSVYGRVFLPFQSPITLSEGDTLRVQLRARLLGDEYLWHWETSVYPAGAATPSMRFQQSTWQGKIHAPQRMQRRAPAFTPTLTEKGEIDRAILAAMNGTTAIQEIAAAIRAQFPAEFASLPEALERVGYLAEKYSR